MAQHKRNMKTKHTHNCQSKLQFTISQNGKWQLCASKENMPEFLIEAGLALKAGQPSRAAGFLTDDAVESITKTIEHDQSRLDVMFVLATLFNKTGQKDKAEQCYKTLLRYERHPVIYRELGRICFDSERISEATEYRRKAVQAAPDNAELLWILAGSMMASGKLNDGADVLQKALELEPENAAIRSNYLLNLHYLPDLSAETIFEEHLKWARIHTSSDPAGFAHDNIPEPERNLRLGYISPDFRMHSVACFFQPLLEGHNRENVELYGYGNVKSPDNVTKRLKSMFDNYRDIRGLDHETTARLIKQDRIDILVDLAGHTNRNLLSVLALKPAPIQVTYLGYPDTTGMGQVDYRLTDAVAESPDSQKFHTEQLVYLPDGFLCYAPPAPAPAVLPAPVLKNGYVTFGSFNNSRKINPHVIELWARVLKAVPQSRLLLKFHEGGDENVKNHYLSQFAQCSISRQRVQICGRKPHFEHLRLYSQVDIALDTYPYNGTTTTCEALWMGVPVISLVGPRHFSRVGLSILTHLGLEFFTAETADQYVAKAAALAAKPDALARIRGSMRTRMTADTLCDKNNFARTVEQAYRHMWRQWCGNRKNAAPSQQLTPRT